MGARASVVTYPGLLHARLRPVPRSSGGNQRQGPCSTTTRARRPGQPGPPPPATNILQSPREILADFQAKFPGIKSERRTFACGSSQAPAPSGLQQPGSRASGSSAARSGHAGERKMLQTRLAHGQGTARTAIIMNHIHFQWRAFLFPPLFSAATLFFPHRSPAQWPRGSLGGSAPAGRGADAAIKNRNDSCHRNCTPVWQRRHHLEHFGANRALARNWPSALPFAEAFASYRKLPQAFASFRTSRARDTPLIYIAHSSSVLVLLVADERGGGGSVPVATWHLISDPAI